MYTKHTTVCAEANLELVYHKGKLWLKLIRSVNKGDELFWKYGSGFHLNGSINASANHDLNKESDSSSDETDSDRDEEGVTHTAVMTAAAAPERSSDRVQGVKISDVIWRRIRK